MKVNTKKIKGKMKVVMMVLAFSLAILYLEQKPLFRVFDSRAFDYFHIVQGTKKAPKNVALVEIDAATFKTLEHEPMAFWGPRYAKVLSTLKNVGVKTVGIDMLFTISIESWFERFGENWAEKSRTYDIGFRRELAKGGVALICTFSTDKEGTAEMQLPAKAYIYTMPNLQNDLGIANLVYDSDGITRRFTNAYFDAETPPYLSFAALLVKKHLGDGAEMESAKDFSYINFNGPPGTFPRVSFSKFLELEEGVVNDPAIKALSGKVVIIALAKDSREDVQQTPYSRRTIFSREQMMTGGEVHANIIETLLSGSSDFFKEMSATAKFLYLFIFSLVSARLFFKLGNVGSVISIFILAMINILAGYTLFNMKVFAPLYGVFSIIGVNYLLSLGIKFTSEYREKKYLRSVFEKCVSGEVVKEMVDSGETPELGGAMKEVTMLFSDIRNFTTISEMLKADEVVEMLNKYLSIICDDIMKEGGTVNKFIGDAVMVIFGSPVYYEDHAERALKVALKMTENAKEFTNWMKRRFGGKYPDLPNFKIGIGLHSGEAIIGNIGSLERLEFTAIGDTVNIASRLEGLTKDFDSDIIVSGVLLSKVKSEVITGKREMIKVKGKHDEIEVVEFLGFKK